MYSVPFRSNLVIPAPFQPAYVLQAAKAPGVRIPSSTSLKSFHAAAAFQFGLVALVEKIRVYWLPVESLEFAAEFVGSDFAG